MQNLYNSNIKAILFDMDGVVIDSEKLYSKSEEGLLAEYGVKFDDSDWHYIKGCTEKQFYDLVYSKFNPDIPREELMSKGRDFLKKTFTKKLEYMDGFCDIHPDLKKKYKLALVTSTGMELVSHIEDSIQGAKAGKAAGCTVVALEGSVDRKFLKEADYIISSLYDIQNII